ncbi:MAG: histidine kinase [Arcicella sp.]|nr:histidine kinase [Arcicella sp.]
MKSSFWGRFWLLGFFTVMAFNGHIYFLVGILRGKAEWEDFIVNIIYSNVFDATIMVLGCWMMLTWGHRIKAIIIRHIILTAFATISVFPKFYSFGFLYTLFRDKNYINIDDTTRDWYDLLFSLGPIIGINIIYYWFTRERKQIIKMTEQEYEILQMNDLKTKAELAALEAKINPHFLYNSLNSIASLVHEDPDKAEHMVMNLSKFYRFSTGRNNQHFDSLKNELEIVKTYLEVEKVRFDERLSYAVNFENENLANYQIPRFLIQPIVENSIKHGISKIAGKGIVEINVGEDSGNVIIEIHDNGVPFPDNIFSGYGLKSIQDKLRILSGEKGNMTITNLPKKAVVLSIPAKMNFTNSSNQPLLNNTQTH